MVSLEEQVGKYLCYMLRHDNEFVYDVEGWVNMERVIGRLKKKFKILASKTDKQVTDTIMKIVKNDDKQRYAIKESSNVLWIRCNYGHSINNVSIEYSDDIPPVILYHGTSIENYKKIQETGRIELMGRQHVHLSEDLETAIKVGKRHGEPVVIVIDAQRMYTDGKTFHKLENNIWLSDDPVYMCYEMACIDSKYCNDIINNRNIMNKFKTNSILNLCNCDTAAVEQISTNNATLSVKRVAAIFNELVKQGKGNYNVNICGSGEYYLYLINGDKLISIDTSPDEFEEYFDHED